MPHDQPTVGDVIIAPASITGRGYTLSIGPDGLSQLWYPSYDAAAKRALEWASASGAEVWCHEGRAGFKRVAHALRES
jgi:hypothetical protein